MLEQNKQGYELPRCGRVEDDGCISDQASKKMLLARPNERAQKEQATHYQHLAHFRTEQRSAVGKLERPLI